MNRQTNGPQTGPGVKVKLGLALTGLLFLLLAAGIIWAAAGIIHPQAVLGEISVSASGQTITPVTNVLKEVDGANSKGYAPLRLEEIAQELPSVVYDGDIVIRYSQRTLDNFSFSLYREDLSVCYTESAQYQPPEGENPSGTYIVKIQFSWGSTEENQIYTENFFKIIYP
jgi:hypothetical protein